MTKTLHGSKTKKCENEAFYRENTNNLTRIWIISRFYLTFDSSNHNKQHKKYPIWGNKLIKNRLKAQICENILRRCKNKIV